MYVCMYVCMYHCFKMKRYDFLHCFCKGGSVFLDPTLVIYKRNWNLTLTASNLQLCDIPFMRSHEARPSTVPPKPELWGSQHCCPPFKTLGRTAVLPDLRHCLQVLHHFLPTGYSCLILDFPCKRRLF